MTQNRRMDDYRPSLIFSTCTWLSLLVGLGAVGVGSMTPGVASVQQSGDRLIVERSAVKAVENKGDRLQRIVTALETNELFRAEWVRREWNAPLAGSDVEAISTGDQFAELIDLRRSFRFEPADEKSKTDGQHLSVVETVTSHTWFYWGAGFLITLGVIGPSIDVRWQAFSGRSSDL